MLRIDEQEILRRLELISQIKPGPEAIALAMERVRRVLVNMQAGKEETSNPIEIWKTILKTRISRFAAAAIITIFVLLPLSYGAVKIIKTYFFQGKTTSVTQKGVTVTVTNATKLFGEWDEEQARKVYDEINRLKKAGKYEKTFVKEWVENGILYRLYRVRYVLASGEVVTMGECRPVNDTNDADANRPEDEE